MLILENQHRPLITVRQSRLHPKNKQQTCNSLVKDNNEAESAKHPTDQLERNIWVAWWMTWMAMAYGLDLSQTYPYSIALQICSEWS